MSIANAARSSGQEAPGSTHLNAPSTGAARRAATSTAMAPSAQLTLALTTGYHAGPLFIVQKRRAPVIHGGTLGGKRRRQREKRATPPWLTKQQRNDITYLYSEAVHRSIREGESYVVDHIVPLDGKIVCGLHVAWNMRVIHWLENARKGTGDWPDMPFEQLELL
jgi:hypothetical protein